MKDKSVGTINRINLGTPIGSFNKCKDDGDSNENVKKRVHVHYNFVTFFCRHYTMMMGSFMEDVNTPQRVIFSLSKLECGLQEFNSGKVHLHLTFKANWNKRRRLKKKKKAN